MSLLRELGCKIAIDDFGTGYSSLEYLHNLPVDVLKLDRIFVQKMSESLKTTAIARTICELAALLSLDVVAEGVEAAHEVQSLTQMGATFFQNLITTDSLARTARSRACSMLSACAKVTPIRRLPLTSGLPNK